jgi:hypothetical protein
MCYKVLGTIIMSYLKSMVIKYVEQTTVKQQENTMPPESRIQRWKE